VPTVAVQGGYLHRRGGTLNDKRHADRPGGRGAGSNAEAGGRPCGRGDPEGGAEMQAEEDGTSSGVSSVPAILPRRTPTFRGRSKPQVLADGKQAAGSVADDGPADLSREHLGWPGPTDDLRSVVPLLPRRPWVLRAEQIRGTRRLRWEMLGHAGATSSEHADPTTAGRAGRLPARRVHVSGGASHPRPRRPRTAAQFGHGPQGMKQSGRSGQRWFGMRPGQVGPRRAGPRCCSCRVRAHPRTLRRRGVRHGGRGLLHAGNAYCLRVSWSGRGNSAVGRDHDGEGEVFGYQTPASSPRRLRRRDPAGEEALCNSLRLDRLARGVEAGRGGPLAGPRAA